MQNEIVHSAVIAVKYVTVIALCNIRAVCLGCVIQYGNIRWRYIVVTVNKHDIFAAGFCYTVVSCDRNSGVFLRVDMYEIITCRIIVYDIHRFVFCAVVDNYYFIATVAFLIYQ